MAITNLTELKTAIGAWSKRPSVLTSDRSAELIALFEADANANLRLRENEISTPLVAVPPSSYIALPSNFQAPVSLHETTQWRRLTFTGPDNLPYYPTAGWSDRWTIKDSRIQTERDADQAYAYTFRYHKTFALSATVTTNTLLTRYPNVYLYGSLLEAAPFLRDLQAVALWQTRYDRAMASLTKAETAYKKIATLSVDPGLMARNQPFNINRGW